ncbi:hypothetical protein AZH51_05685 [Branchiibius sp. NY16-3462-2]|nr:hypothetical protein AZH51_05685 [Branchiibius sp. NY16-3462-2]
MDDAFLAATVPVLTVPSPTGDHVTLRAHAPRDVPAIVAMCTDERMRRFVPLPSPYAGPQALAFLDSVAAGWRDDSILAWAIDVDGSFAGSVNLKLVAPGTREIGFSLHPAYRGQGLMTRAVRTVLDYAYDGLGLGTVLWRAAVGNWASRRVAWANGFTVDGTWPASHPVGDGEVAGTWLGHRHATDPGEPKLPWWEPAVLEGDGVRLRPWRESDAGVQTDDETTVRFWGRAAPGAGSFAEVLTSQQERMAGGDAIFWCTASAIDDQPLGGIELVNLATHDRWGRGRLGYWLHPSARGRGALGKALELLIPHAFGELGLQRLEAGVDQENTASLRVLRRAGFRLIGTEKNALTYVGTRVSDAVQFEVSASDDREAQRVEPRIAPVLLTERLRLRPWRSDDAPRPGQERDELSERFMPANAQPGPALPWEQWFARRQRLTDSGEVTCWCIADATTDEPLGDILLFGFDENVKGNAELGYWLHTNARGHGYVDEAVEAVVRWAFADGGLTRLHAGTDTDNVASQNVLRRAGFKLWGSDRQNWTRMDGTASDGTFFELLATDDREAQRATPPPTLHTDRVWLRPFSRHDAERMTQAQADPVFRHWFNSTPRSVELNRERAAQRSLIDTGRWGIGWVICAPGSDELAGGISIQNIENGEAEIGYWMHPDARGKGLMSAALREVTRWAFADGGFRHLAVQVAEGNEASIRVALAAGYRPVGAWHQREVLGDGRVVDLLAFDRVP